MDTPAADFPSDTPVADPTATDPAGSTRPRREDVRAAILAAATERFAAVGYDRTTLADVAADAGFTKGAVYSNFGGKPELLGAVCAGLFASTAGLAIERSTLLSESRPIREAVDDIAASLARQIVEAPGGSLLLNELRAVALRDAAVSTVYADLRRRLQADLAGRLRERFPGWGLRTDVDADLAAATVLLTVNALGVEHRAAPASMPIETIEAVLATTLRGLL